MREGKPDRGATRLDPETIEALDSEVRRSILEEMAEEEIYPSQAARRLGISKQQAHYHFEKLSDAGLIHKTEEKEGKAETYALSAARLEYELEDGSDRFAGLDPGLRELLEPVLKGDRIDATVVPGSADPHGPDQVRARDGHMAAEIAGRLSEIGPMSSPRVRLDTEIARDGDYADNLVLVGGVLTNTSTKKFNDAFPASFTGESFPYREITTPEATYSDSNVGVIAISQNPEDENSLVVMVAGIRTSGTEAAVLAFDDLEEHAPKLIDRGYVVVRGIDVSGDGEVNSYEVVE